MENEYRTSVYRKSNCGYGKTYESLNEDAKIT